MDFPLGSASGLFAGQSVEQWFVILSKPQQEWRASIELAQQHFVVYLPLWSSKPYFPGYLFVRMDRDTAPWGKIRSTRGCIDLLKSGHLPSPVPDDVMEAIKSRPTAPQEDQDGVPVFTRNQVVRIIDGNGEGLEGLFVKEKRKRVTALLEIMGRQVEKPLTSIRAA